MESQGRVDRGESGQSNLSLRADLTPAFAAPLGPSSAVDDWGGRLRLACASEGWGVTSGPP